MKRVDTAAFFAYTRGKEGSKMLVYLQAIENPAEHWKFEDIYLTYKGLMYAIAFEILGNPQDAEDAVHDAFVKVAENISRIGDPKCPKTKGYIVTVVENKAIDLYRKKKKHPRLEYTDEALGIQVEYECSNILTECILKLPARQRSTIILQYSHGYSIKEIAGILGISYANAMKTQQRAREKLKLLCEEAGLEW
jgi:RNA polymerase sigma-70 factor (ECF subfamily)